MSNCCDNCKFNECGACHRYPPMFIEYLARDDVALNLPVKIRDKEYKQTESERIIQSLEDPLNWAHPQVDQDDWCGEWSAK